MKFSGIVQFQDMDRKRRFIAAIGALTGPHEVSFKPFKPKRSNRANAFYWAAVVTALEQFQLEQGEVWSKEQCHAVIVAENLGVVEFTNPISGVVTTAPKETHTLSTEDFAAFVERAIAWLSSFGIVVQDQSLMKEMA